MAKVVFENITVDYGSVVALKNLSFETRDGEFLVILGPAGAGKTTTLKVAAGLIRPTRGRVYIDDQDVTDVPANERNVAMTFEDYALYPTFTVYENMKNPFEAMKQKPSPADVEAKISQVAKMLQIDHLLDRKVDQLSGGQKQRVSLARSMVRSPKVFLFDEPLSHVDAKIRHSMRAELHRLASVMATTTIYVTHDYVEALSLGDRIIVIDKGVINQIGTPTEIYENPANEFVARVIGQPNINLFSAKVTVSNGEVSLNVGEKFSFKPTTTNADTLKPFEGKMIRVGIRPQDIRFSLKPIDNGAILTKVMLFELWGRRGMIMARLGDETFRILTDTDDVVHIDQPLWLDLNGARLHLFDEAGKRLE